MVEFHQWYQQEIITATFRANRLRYLPFSDPNPSSDVPDDEKGIVWFDSDNTNVKTTTNHGWMMHNYKSGLFYNKIGAKTTHLFQPCDLGSSFRTQRITQKKLTTEKNDSPLQAPVEQLFADLAASGRFTLKGSKLNAIMDCIITSPRLKTRSYSEESVQKSFISAGMIDGNTKSCVDLYQMMSQSFVDFDKNLLLKESFLAAIPACLQEMLNEGFISEDFFDSIDPPCDLDDH